MSEIEKLMQKANVKKKWNSLPYGGVEEYYPEFTAEKQIELIKWLAVRDYTTIVAYVSGEYYSEHNNHSANENSLEGCLARLINNLWQDLSPEEKQQVKGILE